MSRLTPKPGIMSIAPYVGGKSAAKPGQKVVKLSSNETPLGPSPLAVKAYMDAASNLHRYPDGSAKKLKESIKEIYGFNEDELVCGAGSDELIGLLIHAYAGVGDDVVMSRHGFLMYQIYAQGYGANVIMAPEKDLRTDIDAMLAAITPKTKIVFLANPNNPTGSYITKTELYRLHAAIPPHVLLIVDDAYSEYVTKADYSDGHELVASGNVAVLHTFSKIYGLSALRVGWCHASPAIIDVMNRIRGPFNLSASAIEAAAAAMCDQSFTKLARDFNTNWLTWLTDELRKIGLEVHPSIGNFVLVRFPGGKHSASKANAFLLEQGLIVREVSNYGLPDHLRISIGLEDDNRAVVATLKPFLNS